MGATDPSDWSSQPPIAVDSSTELAAWRSIDCSGTTIQSRPKRQQLDHRDDPNPGWSAVQHDFERRLSRFGIKISDASNNSAPSTSNKPIPHMRSHLGAHAIMDDYNRDTTPRHFTDLSTTTEDFAPLEVPTMACFTNNKKESKAEAIERQLREVRTEAQIWKEKSEAQEHDLHVSYRETMEWRMKYEDLYSTLIQDRELQLEKLRKRHGGTKSLG